MKNFIKAIIFLICAFSSVSVFASHNDDSFTPKYQDKLYFESNDLEISGNAIYIHLENNLIESNVVRTDEKGFYIFENDIINYNIDWDNKWKCPYCFNWWELGEKCQNKDCPTNRW